MQSFWIICGVFISYFIPRIIHYFTPMNTVDRDILPTNVKPVHYDLSLTPNLSTFKFSGTVQVHLQVNQDSKEIKLNAKELAVSSAEVLVGGQTIVSQTINHDEKLEILTISFAQLIKSNQKVVLKLVFTGDINDKMAGFYRSKYTTTDGKEKYMAVTQFEATDARRCFPCWDEPALKATFAAKLCVSPEFTALSNMNVIKEEFVNGLKEVSFATTPIVSTYLVAFAVGVLEFIETKTKHNVTVRVYSTEGLISQGKFGLDVAAKTLDFFTEYFDTPYPLPKMDLIAIPDFAAGAMENWGLVTFRVNYLLYDEKQSSIKSKQGVAYVVGHELAHQWFGNLVTMDWWQDLWLNEGFATWVGWLSTDFLFPEWEIWVGFTADEQQRGLGLDSLRSSHPIEVPVKNPSEISQIFDAISYSKGASVIKMLVAFLGEDTFKKGIRNYLKKHMFGNASTKDLWDALEKASNEPVGKIMDSWTKQMGFPVVYVSDAGNTSIKVKQSRFLSSGDVKPEDEQTWFVPLGVLQKKLERNLLNEKEQTISVQGFIKLNNENQGFFRVAYDDALMKGILASFKTLKKADKVGLIADSFSLASSGLISTIVPLNLLSHFKVEDEYIVWSELTSRLNELNTAWWEQPESVIKGFSKFAIKVYRPLLDALGTEFPEKEPELKTLLRNLVFFALGKHGDEKVVKYSLDIFRNRPATIHPSVRGSVYHIVVKNGDAKDYEAIYKIYKTSQISDQRLSALSALGSTKDKELLQKTLNLSISEDVRTQDVIYPIASVASNEAGRLLAWDFVQKNWNLFYDRYYKSSTAILSRIVTSTTSDLGGGETRAKQIEAFFADKVVVAINRSIQQSLEKLRAASRWVERDAKVVNEFMSKQ